MIEVRDLAVRLGAFALDDISFRVADGEYAVLMGKTGCGKSTILECICGLRPIAKGRISLRNREITNLKAAERGVGYVPQDGALFTTMTVRENLGFALRVRKWTKDAIAKRVGGLAELLGIGHLLDRGTFGLSGGEAQRVALGRALSYDPEVLCMDEPMSALDEDTREEMYSLLLDVRARTGVTALHVTHSVSEAERLGDRIFFIEDGRIVERSAGGTAHDDHGSLLRAD